MIEQVPVVQVEADLDGTGLTVMDVASWTVSEELATDVPAQVREVTGLSAAEATVELSAPRGESSGHWSPFRRQGRRTHRPLTIHAGVNGVAGTQVFSGRTTSAPGAARDLGQRLAAVDDMTRLRGDVTLPAWAEAGMTASGPLDFMLRASGYCTTPPLQPGVVLSMPMQGWCAPETIGDVVGNPAGTSPTTYATSDVGVVLVGGAVENLPFPMAGVTRSRGTGLSVFTFQGIDVLLNAAGLPGETVLKLRASDPIEVAITIGETTVEVDVGWAVSVATFTYTPGPMRIRVVASSGGGIFPFTSTQVLFDQPSGSDSDTVAPGVVAVGPFDRITVEAAGAGINAVMVADLEANVDFDAYCDHVSQTDLDSSLNVMGGTPHTLTGPVRDAIRELVEAEFGALWMSSSAMPTFRNRDSLRGEGATLTQVTSYTNLADMTWDENIDAVRTAVEVVTSPVKVTRSASTDVDVWVADSAVKIPAGVVTKMILDLDVAAMGLGTTVTAYDNSTPSATGSYCQQNSIEDGTGAYTPVASVQVRQVGPARVEIALIGGAYDVWLVDTNGEPSFKLRAQGSISQPADQQITTRRDNPALFDIGENVLRLEANPYRQNKEADEDLAAWLALLTARPLPMLTSVKIAPNLAITRGSLVEITDRAVTGAHLKALVVGNNLAGSDGELTQDLTVRPLHWTVAEVDAVWTGDTVDDLDTYWAGFTVADFDANPLGRL